jgi:hypothetical protein
VLNQLPGDTGHVGRAPCKDVSVVPEETGEREFLFGVEVVPNDDFLGRVGQAKADLLDGWTLGPKLCLYASTLAPPEWFGRSWLPGRP